MIGPRCVRRSGVSLVVWVGPGHFGADVINPGHEHGVEFPDLLGQSFREVGCFRDIVSEIEEFIGFCFVPFDEFPVAGAHYAVRHNVVAAIVREVPVNSFALQRTCPCEQGHDAAAVDDPIVGRIHADGLTNCREKVDTGNGFAAGRLRLDDHRPADNKGFADTAFVGVAFA